MQFLLAAPWHLVRSIPGTVLLALWSVGLAIAAALVCYAVAAGVTTTLFVCGLVFAASLWLGPGGSRVRSPLARVVHPPPPEGARGRWRLLPVLVAAAVLGYRADVEGVDWTPRRPGAVARGPAAGRAARALIELRSRGTTARIARPGPGRRSVAHMDAVQHLLIIIASASSLPPDAPTSRPTGGFFVARQFDQTA